MLNFLLAVHFLLTIAIIGLILLQKQDSDGALGSSGGGATNGLFSIRGQANILTRATSTLMAIFMLNCLIMAKMTKTKVESKSVIDRVAEDSQVYKHVPLTGDSVGKNNSAQLDSATQNPESNAAAASKEAASQDEVANPSVEKSDTTGSVVQNNATPSQQSQTTEGQGSPKKANNGTANDGAAKESAAAKLNTSSPKKKASK